MWNSGLGKAAVILWVVAGSLMFASILEGDNQLAAASLFLAILSLGLTVQVGVRGYAATQEELLNALAREFARNESSRHREGDDDA